LFITYAGQNTFVQPGGQSSTDVSLGAKVDAGATVMVTKRIGAFAQYRFTHFTTELDYQNNTPALATETFKTTYDSHHVIAGLSMRF
jgi:opacity protein-like surface antigen